MQLPLHGDLPAPRGEPEFTSVFVDEHDRLDRPLALRHGREKRAVERTQLVVLEAGLLGFPQEALAVLQEAHERAVLLPGVLPLGDDHARRARLRVRGEDIEHILAPRRARVEQFRSVGRPEDVVEVVLGVLRRARRLVEAVDLDGRLRLEVADEERRGRIRGTGLRVRLAPHARVRLGPAGENVEVLHLRLVEAVEREVLRVGAPPHRGGLVEFLAVHPRRLAVLDVVVAVGRQRDSVALARREIQVAAFAGRGPCAVRAFRGRELPSARGAPAAFAALRARRGRGRGRLAVRRRDCARREVERVPALLALDAADPQAVAFDIPVGAADVAALADATHRALHAAHEFGARDVLERRVGLGGRRSGDGRCKRSARSEESCDRGHPDSVAAHTRAWRAKRL